jgi:thioredoxin 1
MDWGDCNDGRPSPSNHGEVCRRQGLSGSPWSVNVSENVCVVTSENWEAEVLGSKEPVLVDFWAVWCSPCRMIAPTIDALAAEYAGRVKVAKVNVDDNEELAARYDIRSIPTLLVFREGRVVDQRVGALPRSELIPLLDRQLVAAPVRG